MITIYGTWTAISRVKYCLIKYFIIIIIIIIIIVVIIVRVFLTGMIPIMVLPVHKYCTGCFSGNPLGFLYGSVQFDCLSWIGFFLVCLSVSTSTRTHKFPSKFFRINHLINALFSTFYVTMWSNKICVQYPVWTSVV